MPATTPPLPDPAADPATPSPDLHWGSVDPHLFEDQARYGRYAAAHHVAGHHWARRRLGLGSSHAGLALSEDGMLPRGQRETAAAVEAGALLVEALAIEAVVCGLHETQVDGVEGLGAHMDLAWDSVAEHLLAARHDARARGCVVGGIRVAALLEGESWLEVTGRKALRDWSGIVALADGLGHGRVLESDEVAALLDATLQ